jgi:HlyD family secretion protein
MDWQIKDQVRWKPSHWRLIALAGIGLVIAGLGGVYYLWQVKVQKAKEASIVVTPAPPPAVSALGRLEPQGEVITLSAPASIEGTRIQELLVEEGDTVNAGEVIAILDSRAQLSAALKQSEKQVAVAESNLAQVQAGAKAGEIAAQKATIARLEAQLAGEKEKQAATITRLQAELRGERASQAATLARLNAQLVGDRTAQEATIERLKAQLATETKAQEATIARMQAEFNNARVEYLRHQELFQAGAIAESLLDSKRTTFKTAQEQLLEEQANLQKIQQTSQEQLIELIATLNKINLTGQEQINEAEATRQKNIQSLQEQLNEAVANQEETVATLQKQIEEANATLDKIAEIRPVDIQAAQAEVEQAEATVEKAQTDLDQAYIKSPYNGQIIKIYARPGEVVGNEGIVELGRTNQMFVVAEIYETDIAQVKKGQPATITSKALLETLTGTVDHVGLKIGKKDVLDTDPAADVDARVVEVKIRLNPQDSAKVKGLTNLQVEVKIFIGNS